MRTIETATDPLQEAIRQELRRAHDGRVLAAYTRREATQLEREAARVARASGMSAVEIAQAVGVSVPRIYQLLQKDSA
jgi:hypothetical protein